MGDCSEYIPSLILIVINSDLIIHIYELQLVLNASANHSMNRCHCSHLIIPPICFRADVSPYGTIDRILFRTGPSFLSMGIPSSAFAFGDG